jgi:hypothetical protein
MKNTDPIVHLYYHKKALARLDCETLGMDRRRIISIVNGHQAWIGLDKKGNAKFAPVVAKLKVRASIASLYTEQLQHIDDEIGF